MFRSFACLLILCPIVSFGSSIYDIQRQFFSCKGAIAYCNDAAVKGDSLAQQKLADAYYEGDGVRQNFTYAFKWYSKAAEQNDVHSLFQLSLFYDNGLLPVKQNDEMALYYKLKASYVGDNQSTLFYDIDVRNYIRRERDFSYHLSSLNYFSNLSNKNDPIAQFVLAEMYLNGKGTLINPFIAKELFGKSCDNGFQAACEEYKYLNEKGI